MSTLLFVISFFISWLFEAAIVFATLLMLATVLDFYLLFLQKGSVQAVRIMAPRFSLGDENIVRISLVNLYPFQLTLKIVEQLPEQFQKRDFIRSRIIKYHSRETITYSLRPVARGEYNFGAVLCYAQSPLSLLQRKFEAAEETTIKVYPSYLQLKKFRLLATTDSLFTGAKKLRRLGHSMEFEKIKNYVQGDDIRTINWKATARSGGVMVNTYTDAREQQVYALIDKGRSMKMSFDGMTLLDYAINATLSLLNVVLMKHDKAGLLTFSNKLGNLVPADKRSGQLQHIVEALYKQQTEFKESDYETLLAAIHKKINQRSFLLLFTNFETLSSLERQLPFLKKLTARHLVCVVFFQNTLLKQIHEEQPDSTEGIYIKTIADRFDYEKKQIVKELRRHGILALLTTPNQLTVDVINKYMELKSRQMV
ncbi:MAG TPA: DUF58 domain-containing protein [Flavipsychrobacter sp.]|nr:DUF58 domain-containing protein [Flavipsychrobacter sp.]